MKVLIIGARGMLGQALVSEFKTGHKVLAWDREEIDITSQENSKFEIRNSKFDLVVNAAAFTDVDGAERNIELANAINGYGVGYLAKTCKELGIPMVHFSTEYVFDGAKQAGYREDDAPNPISVYGQSKYLGEQELQKNTEKYYLIRLSRLFGKATSLPTSLHHLERGVSLPKRWGGIKGEVENTRKRSFVELMLDLAKTKTEIDVVDEEVSSPTYAPDLARATREIVEKKLPFGIYHRTNSGGCTWYEFAREIFKVVGKSVKLKPVPASHFPRPAKRPKHAILLNTKLPPLRPWQEALREFLISN